MNSLNNPKKNHVLHTYHRTEGRAERVRDSTSGGAAVCVSVSVIVTVPD